jgi:hypothetical protein
MPAATGIDPAASQFSMSAVAGSPVDHLCGLRTYGGRIVSVLLQFRVLRFRFFQDGNIGVGVFPEREEVFIGSEGASAGQVGIRSLPLCLKSSRLQRIRPSHAQMCQAPVQQFHTMPPWSRILWNSAAASLPCPAARYASPRTYTW